MTNVMSVLSDPFDDPYPMQDFERLVVDDVREVRRLLADASLDSAHLFRTSVPLSLLHIGLDWIWVFLALIATLQFGWWAVPISLLAIGNRQRALGNVLHDCGHRNVSRRAHWNDFIACAFVAPLLFVDFEQYRKTHLTHHMNLGHPRRDPDYMQSVGEKTNTWRNTFLENVTNPRQWIGTMAGDFLKPISFPKLLYIVVWWVVLLTAMDALSNAKTVEVFLCLWLVSRATVFFVITLYREMCDHFGRLPGGIFQFTRDVTAHSVLRHIVHPKNNGYHLTHHLLPTVPYYHLPAAHAELSRLVVFQKKACICTSYFFGDKAVVRV